MKTKPRSGGVKPADEPSARLNLYPEIVMLIVVAVLTGLLLGGLGLTVGRVNGVLRIMRSMDDELEVLRNKVDALQSRYESLLGAALEVKDLALAHNPNLGRGQAGAIAAEVVRQASYHGLPVELVAAVVSAESGWKVEAVSRSGAVGLMQVMPATGRALGIDPRDWRQNLAGGVRYLKALVDRFGHVETALAAYNAGPTRIARVERSGLSRGGWPRQTRAYVAKVMRAREGRPCPGSSVKPAGE